MPAPTSPPSRLPLSHLFLAVLVVAVWGTNFVVISRALQQLPPLLLATLRFVFAVLPAIFFLPRPAVPWRQLAAYGVLIGAGQFGLLFIAMRADITPGLASLVVQTQVFFTIGLAMRLHRERLRAVQLPALLLAAVGLGVIAAHTDAHTTITGLVLVLLAALCWSAGNLVAKAAGPVNLLAYVVWASLFSVPPLLLLSLLFEGPALMLHSLRHADAGTWLAVVWQAAGNTLFGYVAWAWLLARHPAATVSPLALLVPVFGIGASALLLGEPLPAWKLMAAALVMGGLALNLLGPRLRRRAG
ncbi:EamA family transporter [Pseudorhodoferax sp.]|uniref:EamA family transporter n=1 Tax=Pseudorhodoferax sp. TaxID=1993553 RepID=UPI002DD6B175|nr:EamA family transporter [Pseudorhodoferax sp.]